MPTQDEIRTFEQIYGYSLADGLQPLNSISDADMRTLMKTRNRNKRKRASRKVTGPVDYVPAQDTQGQNMTGGPNLMAADDYYPPERTPKRPRLKERAREDEYRRPRKPRPPTKYDVPVVQLCYDDPQLCDAVIVSGYHKSEFPSESQAKVSISVRPLEKTYTNLSGHE